MGMTDKEIDGLLKKALVVGFIAGNMTGIVAGLHIALYMLVN